MKKVTTILEYLAIIAILIGGMYIISLAGYLFG